MAEPPSQALSQRDPRWANQRLGSTVGPETIGSHGCLITCMTMVAGRNNVGTFNDDMLALGKFVPGSGNAFLNLPELGLHLSELSPLYDQKAMPANWIDKLLAWVRSGKPAIIGVDFRPSPQNTQYDEHYVLVRGVDDHDAIEIIDPWTLPGAATNEMLVPRYGRNNAAALCRFMLYEKA
ncbi:MAG: hypothetical protein K1X39_14775 [Thermoflexales bacterium]|nr:hypothetical protein [Thermoflexales bacterium]